MSFIQVLDPDGNYIRGHDMLGEDLFGTAIQPADLLIDELDRLWILSAERFFVIDREGNLSKIFECRGASYTRVSQPTGPTPPSEDTPRGYTIVASTDTPRLHIPSESGGETCISATSIGTTSSAIAFGSSLTFMAV